MIIQKTDRQAYRENERADEERRRVLTERSEEQRDAHQRVSFLLVVKQWLLQSLLDVCVSSKLLEVQGTEICERELVIILLFFLFFLFISLVIICNWSYYSLKHFFILLHFYSLFFL